MALPVGQVGAGEIGRAAQQLGHRRGHDVQHVLRGFARRHGGGLGLGRLARGLQRLLGLCAQRIPFAMAAQQLAGQPGEGSGIGVESLLPVTAACRTLLHRRPRLPHGGRHLEGRRVPAQLLARQRDLGVAQRRAVRLGRARTIRRAVTDIRLAAHEHRLVGTERAGHRAIERRRVVPIHIAQHRPAIGFEAARRVVVEPAAHLAVDGDAVVVVESHQLVEPPGAGQRTGLVADAFHQAAVAEKHEGAVVDDRVTRAIELLGEQLLRQRHAHGVGDALAQRAGGGFDAGRHAHFRVARRARAELAEALELVHRQVVAAQVQQRIQQHRAVAVGNDEAVAVDPARLCRVVAQVMAPQRFGNVGHAHRHAGMAGVGGLHGIHREDADGIRAELAQTLGGHCAWFHGFASVTRPTTSDGAPPTAGSSA